MTFNQHHTDPTAARHPFTLPDVETFHCSSPEARRITRSAKAGLGWYYWRLDDGDRCPVGPFDTESEALADARD